MAGLKETPRQRMIGLMYLVLTALLALQVSNAVLEKFVFIDESLQHAMHVSRDASAKVFTAMDKKVKDEGSRPGDLAYLKKASEVKEETSKMINEIEKLRQELVDHTGGRDPKTGELLNGKDYDMVMNFMIGPEGSKLGRAYKLQTDLNAFAKKISEMDTALGKQLQTRIALEASEMEQYKNNPDHKSKDFANINFGNTPLVAALAIMSEMETQVARYEAKAMEVISTKVGQVDVKFDKIVAMANAESKVVAAGTMYKATLFLAASASNIVPKMSSSVGAVKLENGIGHIEFKASGSNYDKEGNEKKSWQGAITIRTTRGTDTTFKVEQEYVVAKPVIQIQSATVKALYLNCGNELSVQVPALGVNYDPSFSASSAEVIKGAKKGDIIIVPSAAKVDLTVSSGGTVIGVEHFPVRLLPKPDIEVFSGTKQLDVKVGGPCPRSLTAKALAEQSIKDAIPKDARYKVVGWEISLARGRRLIGSPMKVTSETADVTQFASQSQPGDRLIIEVKGVKRMNFKGATEDVRIGSQIFTYPIN
ncbi:MAG: gliding motility protein GldM [Thermoflexibacter sp.]|jgi:gliding motility-associated protein GldM|nr:gliding motility protein GldM [Thermoflexibacter sp.]